MKLEGEAIRVDGGLSLCNDCAERCWLQMAGECMGFEWDTPPEFPEGLGRCKYFSRIDSLVDASDHSWTHAAVMTAAEAAVLAPTPTETMPGCDENLAQGHTCGTRIAWLMSPAGGSLSDAAARTRVAAEFPQECGACTSVASPSVTATTTTAASTSTSTADESRSTTMTTSPAPAPFFPSSMVLDPCGTNQPWQGDRALLSAQDFSLEGTSIRTDAWLSMCNDCANRCWLQMAGECIGFTWETPSTAPAGLCRCTYYSEIDSYVSDLGKTVVTTVSAAHHHAA